MYVQRGKKKSVCMPGLGSVLVVVHIYVQRYIKKKSVCIPDWEYIA